ncbi:hypothetical protein Tco_0491301 [Tanacetum coccineum]
MNHLVHWNGLIKKFKSKLSNWKANLLSIGGRSTLVNAILGSIGIYYMSIFKVPENILSDIETSHAKGGLNIGSLKAFNLALLQKWRWRLANNPNMLWVQVINAIHGEDAGFGHDRCKTNGVWKKIVDFITQLHSSGIIPLETLRHKLGCGAKVRLWKYTWIGDTTLMQRYNRLFRLDPDPNCVAIDRFVNGEWNLIWSRPIVSGCNLDHLVSLNTELEQISSFSGQDNLIWKLGGNDSFTVKETSEHIDDSILPTLDAPTIWCKSIPRKVNIFL